jgi:cobalt/nickel transport system permease protein
MLILHIGTVPFQDDRQEDQKLQSPWHRLTPQTRILCVLLLLIAIALTPNGHWWTWAIYATGILAVLVTGQVPFSTLLKRMLVELAFVSVLLLGTLFREEGSILWQWGWLKITTGGLIILGSVSSKTLLSLMLLNGLTLTTPVPQLLQGLAALRMPPLLLAILTSMSRYLSLLVEETQAMRRAAVARNLLANQRWQRLMVGNMIGSLFIRTYSRGERVHQAMLARGYEGIPRLQPQSQQSRRDIWALTGTLLFTLLGQAIYLLPILNAP